MGDRDPQERVESALLQLVEVYIRGIDDEDQSDTEERQDEYVRRAQATIQRSAFYRSVCRGLPQADRAITVTQSPIWWRMPST